MTTLDKLAEAAWLSLDGRRGGVDLWRELIALNDGATELPGASTACVIDDEGFAIAWDDGARGPRGVVFVLPDHRQQGRGAALLAALRSEVPGVRLLVLPGDRSAKSLCERAGLTARTLLMGDE